ncbi:MAG: alpha/beta fold hydrolase [Acidimicrobiales bacterium]
MSSRLIESPYRWEYGPEGAPLLLCLHGIGSCADAFIAQQPLADRCGRRVVAWDAPGYRHSPDPSGDPGIDGWADAAAALIAELGYEDADVLGVSWGGVTATRLALRHPSAVRSLILADSSVGSGTSEHRATAMRARAREMEELGIDTFASDRAPKLVNAAASDELVSAVAKMMTDSVRMPAYQWAANSMAEADHRPDLASITCETLVVVGDEDTVTGPAKAVELAAGIPGAEFVTIAAAGHLANQERPKPFNDAVAEFLTLRENPQQTRS